MEYVIRNGATKEEVYLKNVSKDHVQNVMSEYEFGRAPLRKRKWKCVRDLTEERPKGAITAEWTPNIEEALYFQTRMGAMTLIRKWDILRHGVIVEAGIK